MPLKKVKELEQKQTEPLLRVPFTPEEMELYCNLTPDRAFFYFCKRIKFGISFLKDCLPTDLLELLDLEKLTISPQEEIDDTLKRYFFDMLYQVPYKDGSGVQNFYTVLEHKSYPDRWTMFQGFEYVVSILRSSKRENVSVLPTTAFVIVHQGAQPYSGIVNMQDYFSPHPVLRRYAVQFPAILYDTSPGSGRTFVYDANAPEKDLVLKMMRAVMEKEPVSSARQILEEICHRKPDDELVRLRRLFLVSLEKLAKIDFTTVRELEKQTHPKGVEEMSVFEQMMKERGEEALKQGLEQGLEQGQEWGARNSLLFLLKRKFKTVPRRITNRIEQIRDLTVLQSLTVSAAMSETIQEFESDLM